jgi:hypothetical protein
LTFKKIGSISLEKLSNPPPITNLYDIDEITQYINVVIQRPDGGQATYASAIECVSEKIK